MEPGKVLVAIRHTYLALQEYVRDCIIAGLNANA